MVELDIGACMLKSRLICVEMLQNGVVALCLWGGASLATSSNHSLEDGRQHKAQFFSESSAHPRIPDNCRITITSCRSMACLSLSLPTEHSTNVTLC